MAAFALLAFGVCSSVAVAADVKNAKAAPVRAKAKAGTPDLTKDGEPNLLSHAAMVFDPVTGKALYAKNAESAVPIASITKLMTAMVVLEAKQDLNEPVIIDSADIDTIKNSRSRLPVGTAFRREDLMRLALMASDNRAAAALGRSYPGGTPAFVEAMNAKAKLIGLNSTRFVDPTGLAPGNVASPQDLALMVSEASRFPQIREYSTTPELHVTLPNAKRSLGFNNTNALVKNSGWDIGLSKTGYISEAGKCLVMHATIGNNPVVIVLMDSWGKLTRLGDANRIKKWLENNSKQMAAGLARKEG
ncbi:MAG: D-alanyl-D-alanine endopeptidase [Betaproteobacteria bacterium]|nr:D-alanyl-D-alanine endopeptidase [Betaproteobacteria bacterium]